MPSPVRHIRVPDEVWQAAKARAEAEGTTVSAVMVAAVRKYARGWKPTVTEAREQIGATGDDKFRVADLRPHITRMDEIVAEKIAADESGR